MHMVRPLNFLLNSYLLLFIIIITFTEFSLAQKMDKSLHATFCAECIKIDGRFDEPVWQECSIANEFVSYFPNPGKLSNFKSEVKIVYDNAALYIAAYMYDVAPDSIISDLSLRDNLINTDWFSVVIDTYKDGINGALFTITPSGIQYDAKMIKDDVDTNWDAVWVAKAARMSNGWVAEIKIPFSALRFPEKENQEWNINFRRYVRRNRDESTWNEVKPQSPLVLSQCGLLQGIDNVKPPIRLSLTPYVSSTVSTNQSNTSRTFNAGMDVKYGITDAFTLDATLIPDFNQTLFDNKVLNLTPFEVQYLENRPFFTEGIELFNKGGLFYSRRIGAKIDNYNNLSTNNGEYSIKKLPNTAQLLNATKISGRTNKGLGIAILNAIENESFSTLVNNTTSEELRIKVHPFTNYNVTVFDQNLKNNSSITFTNANVIRDGSGNDANNSSIVFDLRNKDKSYAISGRVASTLRFLSDGLSDGYSSLLGFNKTSGNFQYTLSQAIETPNYNPNDLGFLTFPNKKTTALYASYETFQPTAIWLKNSVAASIEYIRLFKPDKFADFSINLNSFHFMMKNFFAFGFDSKIAPFYTYDYFESRVQDLSQPYRYPKNVRFGAFISTNYAKTFAIDISAHYRHFFEELNERNTTQYSISPRLRVNDRLFITTSTSFDFLKNDIGFAKTDTLGNIFLGRRNRVNITNTLSGRYIINNKMGFTVTGRQYYSDVNYLSFYLLEKDGKLSQQDLYSGVDNNNQPIHNISVNFFNLDIAYNWRFAPGSDLVFVWKNILTSAVSQANIKYFDIFSRNYSNDLSNIFSLKILYYIDYVSIKKELNRHK